jgi:hypothetical protein
MNKTDEVIERLTPPAKRKVGCPKGTVKSKIAKALISTSSVCKDIESTFEKMNDRDRKIFVSLTSGDDELIACLKAEYYAGIRNIVKIVYTKDHIDPKTGEEVPGGALHTRQLTIKNVEHLDEASYQRLLRVARTDVKHLVGKTDYHNLISDVKGLFRLIAPEQIAVLASIARKESAKDSDRIKAANSILDRADYKGPEAAGNAPITMPVQVNVVIGGKPKAEFNPIIEAQVVQPEGA